MDFIVKLLKLKHPITRQEYNNIFIIIIKFIKQRYFITYTEEILAKDVAQIYIKEVFLKYKIPAKIILNRDIRFISAF